MQYLDSEYLRTMWRFLLYGSAHGEGEAAFAHPPEGLPGGLFCLLKNIAENACLLLLCHLLNTCSFYAISFSRAAIWVSAIITINRIAIITLNRVAIITLNRIAIITINRIALPGAPGCRGARRGGAVRWGYYTCVYIRMYVCIYIYIYIHIYTYIHMLYYNEYIISYYMLLY